MMTNNTTTSRYFTWLYVFIAAAVVVNFSGLFVTLIAPDATLYATVAKNMVLRHDYVNLVVDGKDWLDKPHFPFWITAISFNIFGFTTWAYKLPGILFLMMGAAYTYRFAKSLYNKEVALWAALILLTAEHIIISDSDVRAEPYLTGLIIAAVFHFYRAYNFKNNWHLLAGCAFTACAMMTKGIFVAVPIGGAFAGHFIITKQWQQSFSWRSLVAVVLTVLLITPELYCLYHQFDLHPEKVVFGQKGVSGIGFYFWGSQFGRFLNTGPIKGGGDPFFFIHTTLWAFLPWSLLLFAGIYQSIKKGVKSVQTHEWYCLCGGLLTFLMFSASRFQLPFYLNIVYPFFAIILAQYLYNVRSVGSMKAILITQFVVVVLMLIIAAVLQYFFNAPMSYLVMGILLLLFGMAFLLPRIAGDTVLRSIIFNTAAVAFVVNLYFNLVFYPKLMQYQGGSQAAMIINAHNTAKFPVMQCEDSNFPLEFYLKQPLMAIDPGKTKAAPGGPFLLYASNDVIKGLAKRGWDISPFFHISNYSVSRLKPKFLNQATRYDQLTQMQVVLVNFSISADTLNKYQAILQKKK